MQNEEKRDFSLRGPTTLQEQSGKKKRRPAPFEMTGLRVAYGLEQYRELARNDGCIAPVCSC